VVGRREAAVVALVGLLVGVAEHDELELGAGEGGEAALAQALELAAQDLPWRGRHVGAVEPADVREAQRRALVPGHVAQRREVRAHLEVAVAALPGRQLVALDGVHVDVDGQQVVARLGAVLGDLLEEVAGGHALPHEPPLHVGQAEQHGVHGALRRGAA
jgi:hypothetical protein